MAEEPSPNGLSIQLEGLSISEDTDTKPKFKFNFNAPKYVPTYLRSKKQEVKKTLPEVSEKPPPTKNAKKSEESSQKAKILSEAEKMQETVNIVFIGHVDAGKSTIGGHILYLTGMVDKRTLEKYEREAKEKNRETWYLSWALDTNSEERDKGKTVEVARASFETATKKFVLLDAPGHKGYVPNMIGGTAQADIAVLVISARVSEFETGFDKGGQTREHAQIARISGVKMMIIVVNKMDDPSVLWNRERYDEICGRLKAYLKKIGWKSSELHFLPISGFTGANLKEPVPAEICPWWNGKPFLEYLESLPPMNTDLSGKAFVIINDKYKDMGLVCMGKVISGCFAKNEVLKVMPIGKKVKVCTILSLDDQEKPLAKVGENLKLRFSNAVEEDFQSGFVLCEPNSPCPVSKRFEAQLIITECKFLMCSGFRSIIHIHNVVDEVTVTAIKGLMDRRTQKWTKKVPRFVKQDQICILAMELQNPQCIAPFAEIAYLGRFSLREEGKTIAFGKILSLQSD